jgi:hypothetical protein
MKRLPIASCVSLLALWIGGVDRTAHAAAPTTADCLGASEAALKSGNDHKVRAERSQLLVCASASCPADIRKECAKRVDEVNAQIPTIIFGAKDASGADVSTVKVTMDGEVLAGRLEGTALSIDPGEHTFTFETANQPRVTKTFTIQQAQKDRRELITFGVATTAPSPLAPTPRPIGDQALPENPPGTDGHQGLGTQKILAIVAGGIGVVGLGLGTAFGVMAISQKSDAQNTCAGSQCATLDGVNKWNKAGSTGNVSTIGFVIGGVGVAGAAALWVTAPGSRGGAGPQVGFGPGALQVKGTW